MVSLPREELLMASPKMERGSHAVNCAALPGKGHYAARQADSNYIRDGPILKDREDSTGRMSARDDSSISFKYGQVRKGDNESA